MSHANSVFILVGLIYLAAIAKLLWKFIFLVKRANKRYQTSDERNKYIQKSLQRLHKSIPAKTELAKFHWLNSTPVTMLRNLVITYITPVFFFRASLIILTNGVRVVWRIPCSFYDVWDYTLIYYAYTQVGHNLPITISILIIIFLNHAFTVSDYFNPLKKQSLYYAKLPHKLSVGDLLHTYFAFVGCFAVLYSILNQYGKLSSANALNTFIDFLYVSITTMTTVGFGDIHPTDTISRAIFAGQMIAGIFLNLLFVSMFVGMWISIRGTADTHSDDTLSDTQ